MGTVAVGAPDANTLLFTEAGHWTLGDNARIQFHNVYRWRLDDRAGLLHVEHLRFGADQPVYLLALSPVGETRMTSVAPHVCREDRYTAELLLSQGDLHLNWSIIGPHKHDEIDCVYR